MGKHSENPEVLYRGKNAPPDVLVQFTESSASFCLRGPQPVETQPTCEPHTRKPTHKGRGEPAAEVGLGNSANNPISVVRMGAVSNQRENKG